MISERDFDEYIIRRNLKMMTKTEWEMLWFSKYCQSKYKINSLSKLKSTQIGELSDELGLTYSQISSLIRNSIVIDREFDESFVEMLNSSLTKGSFKLDKNGDVYFDVSNALLLEHFRRKLRDNNIFQDTSFNKNIITLSADNYLMLVGHSATSISEKLYNSATKVANKVVRFVSGNIDTNQVAKQIENSIIEDRLSGSISKVVSSVEKVISMPKVDIVNVCLELFSAKKEKEGSEILKTEKNV